MKVRAFFRALCAVGASLALSTGLIAQKRPPTVPRAASPPPGRLSTSPRSQTNANRIPNQKTPFEEFETLSPAEQQKVMERLSPNDRKQLQERLDQFHQLPAEQQHALISFYNRLHQLPGPKQDAVRKAWNKFSDQPKERQQVIRDELRDMADRSSAERKAEWAGPAFKARFSKKEQDIVRDLEPLLPQE